MVTGILWCAPLLIVTPDFAFFVHNEQKLLLLSVSDIQHQEREGTKLYKFHL